MKTAIQQFIEEIEETLERDSLNHERRSAYTICKHRAIELKDLENKGKL